MANFNEKAVLMGSLFIGKILIEFNLLLILIVPKE